MKDTRPIPEAVLEAKSRGVIIAAYEGITEEEMNQLLQLRAEQAEGLPNNGTLTWDRNGDLLDFYITDPETGEILSIQYLGDPEKQETLETNPYMPVTYDLVKAESLEGITPTINGVSLSATPRAASAYSTCYGNANGGVCWQWHIVSQDAAANTSTIMNYEGGVAATNHAWTCSRCQTRSYYGEIDQWGGWSTVHSISVNDGVPGYSWPSHVCPSGSDSSCQRTIPHEADGTLSTRIGAQLWIESPHSASPPQYTTPYASNGLTGYYYDIDPIVRNSDAKTISITATSTPTSVTFNISGGTTYNCSISYYRVLWQIDYNIGYENLAPGVKTYTKTGLTPGTTYSIRVDFVDSNNKTADGHKDASIATIKVSAPVITTISTVTLTPTKITFSAATTVDPNDSFDHIQYKAFLHDESGDSINWTTNLALAGMGRLTGLIPNKLYTLQVQAITKYGISEIKETIFVTPIPPAPNPGKISISNITTTGATVTMSEWSFGEGGTFGRFRWRGDFLDGLWSGGTTGTFEVFQAPPGTLCTIYVSLNDNYSTVSDEVSASFTTLVDQASIPIKVGGVWKTGKVFTKVNGTWQKGKKAYIKSGSAWKEKK